MSKKTEKKVKISIDDCKGGIMFGVEYDNDLDAVTWENATAAQKTGAFLQEFAEAEMPLSAKRDLADALNKSDFAKAVAVLFVLAAEGFLKASPELMAGIDAALKPLMEGAKDGKK